MGEGKGAEEVSLVRDFRHRKMRNGARGFRAGFYFRFNRSLKNRVVRSRQVVAQAGNSRTKGF